MNGFLSSLLYSNCTVLHSIPTSSNKKWVDSRIERNAFDITTKLDITNNVKKLDKTMTERSAKMNIADLKKIII
ncbi:MAG: hypothetical protein ACI8RD_011905 [Bacillariaceae sp.]|jgi:hypothetical protein